MPRLNDQLFQLIESSTYIANSFTSVWPLKVKRPPPRERSNGSRTGLKSGYSVEPGAFGFVATFCWKPEAPHCVGSVNPSTGTFGSAERADVKHGALNVGSTMPR